jgi:hypothetical protein
MVKISPHMFRWWLFKHISCLSNKNVNSTYKTIDFSTIDYCKKSYYINNFMSLINIII